MASHRPTPGSGTGPNAAGIPAVFHVGNHVVRIVKVMEGRWTMSVDDAPGASSFATQAEAWEAGVREADRLDRTAPAESAR